MSNLTRRSQMAYRASRNPDRAFQYIQRKMSRRMLSKYRSKKLQSSADETVSKLGKAFYETVSTQLSDKEQNWVNSLEKMRGNIDSNSTTITVTDYGAGSADVDRTNEEMEQGVKVDRTVSELAKSNPTDCLLLFKFIRELNPNLVLEMGTSVGMAAAYQAAALELNNSGELITLEGSENIASYAQDYLNSVGLDNSDIVVGKFQDTLPTVLDRKENFDIAYIDGHHDGNATLEYFDQIYPHLSEKSILIFDDIRWSEDMNRAWKKIKTDERICTTIDTGTMGICSTRDSINELYTIHL